MNSLIIEARTSPTNFCIIKIGNKLTTNVEINFKTCKWNGICHIHARELGTETHVNGMRISSKNYKMCTLTEIVQLRCQGNWFVVTMVNDAFSVDHADRAVHVLDWEWWVYDLEVLKILQRASIECAYCPMWPNRIENHRLRCQRFPPISKWEWQLIAAILSNNQSKNYDGHRQFAVMCFACTFPVCLILRYPLRHSRLTNVPMSSAQIDAHAFVALLKMYRYAIVTMCPGAAKSWWIYFLYQLPMLNWWCCCWLLFGCLKTFAHASPWQYLCWTGLWAVALVMHSMFVDQNSLSLRWTIANFGCVCFVFYLSWHLQRWPSMWPLPWMLWSLLMIYHRLHHYSPHPEQ